MVANEGNIWYPDSVNRRCSRKTECPDYKKGQRRLESNSLIQEIRNLKKNGKRMLVTNTGQTCNEDNKRLDILHCPFVSKHEADVVVFFFFFLHELSQLRFGLSARVAATVHHLIGTFERVLRNFAFRHSTRCAL